MFRIISVRLFIAYFAVSTFFFIATPPVTAATLTVDTLVDELADNGNCSLREAIANINSGDQSGSVDCTAGDPAAADIITFNVTGTIVLGSFLPNITQELTIDGQAAENLAISGNNAVGVLRVNAAVNVTIQNLTLANGNSGGTLGGGIYNQGNLTVSNCIISNCQDSAAGGAIFNVLGSTLTINDTTISGNSSAQGGGIYNMGTALIERSTISSNSASSSGGGLYNENSATLRNVNISNNQSIAAAGVWTQPGTTNAIENCTIADNQNTSLGNGAGLFGSGFSNHNLRNTIISNNTNQNGTSNCYQVFSSLGYNISSDGTCVNLNNTGDLLNTDPLLGSLQDNGGPTFTHALLEGSPAVDAGDPANCPAVDQRGISRPIDGDKDGNAVCDIGSVEIEKSSFPWSMFLPAFTKKQSKSVWRVQTRVSCDSPMTFTVTLEGASRSSVMRPLLDFEGSISEWASTDPGPKKFSWQAACPTYPRGWSGNVNKTLKDGKNYLLVLVDGGGFPIVNVQEGQGIP